MQSKNSKKGSPKKNPIKNPKLDNEITFVESIDQEESKILIPEVFNRTPSHRQNYFKEDESLYKNKTIFSPKVRKKTH